jgi:hypothetical protein
MIQALRAFRILIKYLRKLQERILLHLEKGKDSIKFMKLFFRLPF